MGINSSNNYDVIVVGIGAVGSAATYHLAKRGVSVLGLEQHGIPNSKGSSRGDTRVINPITRKRPEYVPLIQRALELWHQLQKTHPNRLIRQTGALRGWPSSDYTGRHGSLKNATTVADTYSLSYETLTSDELSDRFPGYDFPSHYRFLLQPDGGVLDPQECIIAHTNQAHEHGAKIKAHEKVKTWESTSNGVQVQTNKGKYSADELVITAGPWISVLVNDIRECYPQRAVMGWFRPKQPEKFSPKNFPAFTVDTEEGDFYGTPAHRINGVKVGGRTTDIENEPSVDPDTVDRTVSQNEIDDLRKFLTEYLSDAAGPTLRLVGCMITRSVDSEYILDTHPDHTNVHVAGGFTGSGLMTASAVGEIVANLALNRERTVDISPFSIDNSQ